MLNFIGANLSSIGFGNKTMSGVIFYGYIGVSNGTSIIGILSTCE